MLRSQALKTTHLRFRDLMAANLNLAWLCTKASQTSGTFSGTFSVTLLNLTWLCTKPPTPSPEPSPEPCWTWPGSAPNRNPVEPDLALRQGFLEPSPEPSPEPFWTWLSSAPKPPRPSLEPSLEPSPEPSPEPCFPYLLRKLLRNLVEPDPAPAPVHTGAILGWRRP